jgi:glyoxylase-like metal-dependent hydrolase (beta-lactamase superfamily II)
MGKWKYYFDNPAQLKLYVMKTGEVHTGGNIHYNKKSPKFKNMPKENRFNPVYSFLLLHPNQGMCLFDTGLHHSFTESRFGNFGPLLGSMVRGKAEMKKDVCSQLKSMGKNPMDIKYIFLSHLHLDHPSGLPYFMESVNLLGVYVDNEELRSARAPFGFLKGYVKNHLKGIRFQPIQYELDNPPFDRVCDVFGDGSTFLVRTPGHTVGHVSALLNASGGPIFLTFDAVHRKSNLDENMPPSGDYEKSMATLKNIESFIGNFPKTRVIFGHDPDQMKDLILAPEYYS